MATALLYKQVADWCCLDADNIVLDICCGTGTIGLTLAKSFERRKKSTLRAPPISATKRSYHERCQRTDNALENRHCPCPVGMCQPLIIAG